MTVIVTSDPEQLLLQAQAGDVPALGQLLEKYQSYLMLLARLQIGRRLQGKVDPADLVQETFLNAHRDFAKFRGDTEAEWLSWLREILACNLAHLIRRYLGTQRRDVRLERELKQDLNHSSQVLGQSLIAPQSSPSQSVSRREQAVLLACLHQLADLGVVEVETVPVDQYVEAGRVAATHLEAVESGQRDLDREAGVERGPTCARSRQRSCQCLHPG